MSKTQKETSCPEVPLSPADEGSGGKEAGTSPGTRPPPHRGPRAGQRLGQARGFDQLYEPWLFMEAQAPTSCRLGLGLVTGTLDIGSPPRGCPPGVLAPLPPAWPLPCPLASTPGNRAGASPWARSPHTGASRQLLCKGQASSELLPRLRPFAPAVGPAARSPPALRELLLLQATPAPRSPP